MACRYGHLRPGIYPGCADCARRGRCRDCGDFAHGDQGVSHLPGCIRNLLQRIERLEAASASKGKPGCAKHPDGRSARCFECASASEGRSG